MMKECDVLVIGGGPAGLSAAITASKANLKTILVEQNSEIGSPIKTSAFTFKEVLTDWSLSDNVMEQWVDSFYVNSLNLNKEVEVTFNHNIGGYLKYTRFLQELSFKAIQSGTHMLLSETVSEPIMDGNDIIGANLKNKKKIASKIIIDCSGPHGTIARKFDLLPKMNEMEMGIGREYEMSNVLVRNQKSIDFYVGKKQIVPIGYGWVFPLSKNRARIGICTVHNTSEIIEEKNIRYWHERFLKGNSPISQYVKNAQPYAIHSGMYPLCGIIEKPYANGLIIAGDSAAQASMLLGEGIRYAMEFGKYAGMTAIESIEKNDCSEDYLKTYVEKCYRYLDESYDVALDLLQVPTDQYWDTLVENMIRLKRENKSDKVLQYLKTAMTYKDAKEIFPEFIGKYLK